MAAHTVNRLAGDGLGPLAILKKLVVAFENEENLIFILMGVGRGATAGRRGLDDGCGAAVCHFAREQNLDGLAEDRKGFCVAQERSFQLREYRAVGSGEHHIKLQRLSVVVRG